MSSFNNAFNTAFNSAAFGGTKIDNAEKRKNISGIWIPLIPGVTPNSNKDAQWRLESGWSYSGGALGAISAPPKHEGFMINVGKMLK